MKMCNIYWLKCISQKKEYFIYQQVALSICPDHANRRQYKTAIEMSSQTEIMPPLQSDDFHISIEADNFLYIYVVVRLI